MFIILISINNIIYTLLQYHDKRKYSISVTVVLIGLHNILVSFACAATV